MQQETLFDLAALTKTIEEEQARLHSTGIKIQGQESHVKLAPLNAKITDIFGKIEMGTSYHYVSIAEWSMHELLLYLLNQTGPSHVYIATWSVSELAVRQLLQAIQEGHILSLIGLFDWRVKLRRPEVYELIKYNISTIRLTTCHAKVTLILNDDWGINIVGSANYTNNPRIEAGVVTCNREITLFHQQWMIQELNHSDPFETTRRRKS